MKKSHASLKMGTLACLEGAKAACTLGIKQGDLVLEPASLLLKQAPESDSFILGPAGEAIYEHKNLAFKL